MRLPVTALVAIVLAVIAVTAIVAFFVTTGGGAAARAGAQKTFAEGCLVICSIAQNENMAAVRLAYSPFDDWMRACEQIHGAEHGAYLACLSHCACGTLPTLCDRLQMAANDVGANCPFLCEAALTHNATKLLYQGCECKCA